MAKQKNRKNGKAPERKTVTQVWQPKQRPPAMPLTPDATPRKIRLLSGGFPSILITSEALSRMWHYINMSTAEVGWLGSVEELPNNVLVITQVYLFKQTVNSANTTITTEGLEDFGQELMMMGDEGIDIWNSIKFWGHYHPHGSTTPSAQDETQMEIFENTGHQFFIRGIATRKGSIDFSVFDYKYGIIHDHVPWSLYHEIDASLKDDIEAEFTDKVTESHFVYPKGAHVGVGAHFHGGYLPGSVAGGVHSFVTDDAPIEGNFPYDLDLDDDTPPSLQLVGLDNITEGLEDSGWLR